MRAPIAAKGPAKLTDIMPNQLRILLVESDPDRAAKIVEALAEAVSL